MPAPSSESQELCPAWAASVLPHKRHMNGHGTMLSESLLPGRDLGAAREAFVTRDAEASRTAHETTEAPELHQTGGEHVKTIVFGGLDGILTAHAVIAAAVGAKLAPGHVLVGSPVGLLLITHWYTHVGADDDGAGAGAPPLPSR